MREARHIKTAVEVQPYWSVLKMELPLQQLPSNHTSAPLSWGHWKSLPGQPLCQLLFPSLAGSSAKCRMSGGSYPWSFFLVNPLCCPCGDPGPGGFSRAPIAHDSEEHRSFVTAENNTGAKEAFIVTSLSLAIQTAPKG